MTPAERTMLRTIVHRARQAWVDAQGGYLAVEADAAELESLLGVLAIPIRPKQTKVDVDLIQRLRAQGWKLHEIAAHVGCGRSTVCYWTNHHYRLKHILDDRQARKKAA